MNNNILIIEDDKDIRERIRFLLESESFVGVKAQNGLEGLKTCEEIRFQVWQAAI